MLFESLAVAVTPVCDEGSDAVVVLVPADLIDRYVDITVMLGGKKYAVLECSVKEFKHLSRLGAVHCGSLYSCPEWVKDVKRPC